MTGRQLSDKSGVSQGHISELENGRKNLTDSLIDRLSTAFNTESGTFISEIESLAEECLRAEPKAFPARFIESTEPSNLRLAIPDDMHVLAQMFFAKMSTVERADFLRELNESAISGDEMASAAARAMLLLIRKFTNSSTA